MASQEVLDLPAAAPAEPDDDPACASVGSASASASSASTCPFKGRRCPDFACGVWKDFLGKVPWL